MDEATFKPLTAPMHREEFGVIIVLINYTSWVR